LPRESGLDAFLDEACAGDETLGRQVAALLVCDMAHSVATPSLPISTVSRANDNHPEIKTDFLYQQVRANLFFLGQKPSSFRWMRACLVSRRWFLCWRRLF
jgi:hypothetical protein